MNYPSFKIQDGKEYMNDKLVVQSLVKKDGLMLINDKTLFDIWENSNEDMELVRETFVQVCICPDLASVAVELNKKGYAPLQIIAGFSAVFFMGRTDARLLFDNLCYPALVELGEQNFITKLNTRIVELRNFSTSRILSNNEKLELSIWERLEATNDTDVVRAIRSEVQAMEIDATLKANLLQWIGEKRDLC